MTFLLQHRIRVTQITALLLLFLLIFSQPAITHPVLQGLMHVVGYYLIILCVLGRILCSVFIGGRKNQVLMTEGIFALSRNPLYVFSFLGIAGIGFESGSLILLLLLMGLFCVYFRGVVAIEEDQLIRLFGADYIAYQKDVPRWIPKKWRCAMPETMNIYPKIIFKTMIDASYFFIALPLFQLLHYLHYINLLPTYLFL